MDPYTKVEALRAKYPNAQLQDLIKKAKVSHAGYYNARKRLLGTPKTKTAYKRVTAQPAPEQDNLIRVIIGTAAQIREVLQ